MVVFLLEPVLGKAGKVNQINRAVTIGRWSDIPDENGIGLQPVINQERQIFDINNPVVVKVAQFVADPDIEGIYLRIRTGGI